MPLYRRKPDRSGFSLAPRRLWVLPRQSSKSHETVERAPTDARFAPIILMKVNYGETRRWELTAHSGEDSAFPILRKCVCDLGEAWVVPDNQQGFDNRRRPRKRVQERAQASAVERRFDYSRKLARQFTLDDLERLTRSPRWRDKDEVGSETRLTKICADARRAGAAGGG